MINVNDVIKFEAGEMSDDELVTFFQSLINSGDAWRLQGMYGRTAMALIEDGLCTLPEGDNNE